MNIENNIIEAIDIMLRERLSALPFNYRIEGKIIEKISSSKYKALIDGEETTVYSGGQSYEVNDIVLVIVMNNNYSDKWIFGLKEGVDE